MKKTVLCLLCFGILALKASAQYSNRNKRTAYEPKREITLRWGMVEDPFEMWSKGTIGIDDPLYRWRTPLERYNRGKYFYGKRYYTQAISLSYTQEMKRWLALSINMSYSGVYQDQKITGSELIVDTYYKHRLSIYPMIRFTYLNKPMIRLYSGLGLGVGMTSEKDFFTSGYEKETYLTGQVTFFGISFGKTIFSSWEIGYGARGYLTTAIGYRF